MCGEQIDKMREQTHTVQGECTDKKLIGLFGARTRDLNQDQGPEATDALT